MSRKEQIFVNKNNAKKLKIDILSEKTSWVVKYDLELKKELEKRGHDVILINSKEELRIGDVAIFQGCYEIIGKKYLDRHKYNLVIHASNLPKGKGWSSATWQILEGKNTLVTTLFEATEKVDAGNYYIKDNILLDGTELIDEWQDKVAKKENEILLKFIDNINSIKSEKQHGEESFYQRRTPKDSELDIDKTIREQFNLLRVVSNNDYPAFFVHNNCKYKIQITKY